MNTTENNLRNGSRNILLIAGSPSAPSRSARLLEYVDTLLAQAGYATDRLNVRDLPAEALLHANFEDPLLRKAQKRVARAQAIVLATPVYKAAYSGVLKAFLDLLPQDALAGKTALAIVTGGNPKQRIFTDFVVRQLLSALSTGLVPPTVFADNQIVLLCH